MAGLADTTVLITVERRRGGLAEVFAAIPEDVVAIASISASELMIGAIRADSPERRALREAFAQAIFRGLTVLPFDLRSAHLHAEARVYLESRGQMIGAYDLMVAATALALGYTVYTDNLREFRRVPGLVVSRPAW